LTAFVPTEGLIQRARQMRDKPWIETDTQDAEAILAQALDWIVLLKTSEPTRADIDELHRWRSRSAAHDEAFKTAARLFRRAGIAASELANQSDGSDPVQSVPRRQARVLFRRAFLGGAIAAATAGYLVVRPPLGLWPSLEELSADYRTGKGEQRTIAVAPGLSLRLNTQTSITLQQQQETRIELISGEASVAATRTSPSPLVMLAGNGRITAVEAEFNARCIDDVVSVTCLAGVVDVTQDHKEVRLQKAEQVSYGANGMAVSVSIDPSQVTAWQEGLLIFRDASLSEVVEEVNRYRTGKIIITNADLRRRLVNGTFQISKLDDFVPQVEQLFGARARSLLGGVVLLG
jgi:transmembrane sensor